MNIPDALTKYAATLEASHSLLAPSAAQVDLDRNAAAEALDSASSLIRLRWFSQRVSPASAAAKVRGGSVTASHLRRWAKAIDAFEKHVNANPKVEAAIRSLPSDFSTRDFLDLALAAIDQAGVAVRTQDRIEDLLDEAMPPAEEEEAEEQTALADRPTNQADAIDQVTVPATRSTGAPASDGQESRTDDHARRFTPGELAEIDADAAARVYTAKHWKDDALIATGSAEDVAYAIAAIEVLGAIVQVTCEDKLVDEVAITVDGPQRLKASPASDYVWGRALEVATQRSKGA